MSLPKLDTLLYFCIHFDYMDSLHDIFLSERDIKYCLRQYKISFQIFSQLKKCWTNKCPWMLFVSQSFKFSPLVATFDFSKHQPQVIYFSLNRNKGRNKREIKTSSCSGFYTFFSGENVVVKA